MSTHVASPLKAAQRYAEMTSATSDVCPGSKPYMSAHFEAAIVAGELERSLNKAVLPS